MSRDYFSSLHNALLTGISIFYLILFAAGIAGVWSQNKRFFLFLICGIFLFSLPSVVFCQDWSGRFSLPVFVFVLLFCSLGIDYLRGKIQNRHLI